MKLRLIFLTTLVTLLICNVTFSQERKIIGRILDAQTQKPIRNANIVFLDTLWTFSNHLGFFELTVDPSKHKSVIVSHIGFKTSEVQIPEENKFKFFLEKEYIRLNEIDLNAYPKEPTNEQLNTTTVEKTSDKFPVVESLAMFSGGIDNFYDFIGNSLTKEGSKIPKRVVEIKFTVDEGGQPTNILVSDSTELVKTMVDKVFQQMPAWTPAKQGQNKVAQHFIFRLVHLSTSEKQSAIDDLYQYIIKNLTYPAQARRMGVEGMVSVKFNLDSAGIIKDIKVVNDIGADCGKQAMRVISNIPTGLS